MELVTPSFGLVIWMTVVFLIVLFLLTKFAWKPIMKSIKEREFSIDAALKAAENAKREMESLKASNEKLMRDAREERDQILKEARDAKDAIIAEAKNKARTEADKVIKSAKETIQTEKMAAITELKNQVATLSIEIAEKILRQELSSDEKQKTVIQNLLKEVNLN